MVLAIGVVAGERKTTYDLGGRQSLDIEADASWEITRGVRYRIRAGKEIVVPATYFLWMEPGQAIPKMTLAWAKDRDVVALIAQNDPDEVLILYRTSTRESWPYRAGDETYDASNRKKQALLAALRER